MADTEKHYDAAPLHRRRRPYRRRPSVNPSLAGAALAQATADTILEELPGRCRAVDFTSLDLFCLHSKDGSDSARRERREEARWPMRPPTTPQL